MLSSKSLGRMCLQAIFGPKLIETTFVLANAVYAFLSLGYANTDCVFSLYSHHRQSHAKPKIPIKNCVIQIHTASD